LFTYISIHALLYELKDKLPMHPVNKVAQVIHELHVI